MFWLTAMATCSFIEFKVLEPVHHLKSSTSFPTNSGRNLLTSVPFKANLKANVDFQTLLLKSTARYDPCQKIKVQDLVDGLHECAANELLKEAKAIHGQAFKYDFTDEDLVVLLNHVMHAYSKCLDFRSAGTVFKTMSMKNVFSWTVMIGGSTNSGFLTDGLNYFFEMLECGILLDAFAYSVILKLCIGLDCLDLGEMMHAQIIIKGFASHVFVNTSLLSMYAKLGEIQESVKIFNNMNDHNEVSWNAMISGFTENGLSLEAFEHFLMMMEHGFTPDMYSVVSVLKAIGKLGDFNKAKEAHKYVSDLGLESNVRVGTALIDLYSRCGALNDAISVFNSNFSNCGLNIPWNAMIGGYSRCNYCQEALQLYVEMCKNNIESDVYTYCSVFDAIGSAKCFKILREVHGKVLKSGYDLIDLSIENAIADAYSSCSSLWDVRKVFDRMKGRDLVSWTILVGAYSRCSEWEEGIITFCQMRDEGFIPNQFTLSTTLIACASLCDLELGEQLHGLVYKTGLDADSCVHSAVIDVYGKCGSVKVARKVFDRITDPDVVSWTAMISSYAQHGLVADALQLFRWMEKLNVRPTAVTFLCVLFACSHVGMVEEGLQHFRFMRENYNLEPEMEHYACIVDLLGRVGHLSEALHFIEAMPVKPDEMVWQAMLAACRVHGNVDLGELAAKNILSVQPQDSAAYVLLSNIYTETGSFRSGLQLRKLMKDRGIKKEPGYSCIALKGKVHKFYAGDQEHPQKDDIYLMLDELGKMMKLFGCVPTLKYALRGED